MQERGGAELRAGGCLVLVRCSSEICLGAGYRSRRVSRRRVLLAAHWGHLDGRRRSTAAPAKWVSAAARGCYRSRGKGGQARLPVDGPERYFAIGFARRPRSGKDQPARLLRCTSAGRRPAINRATAGSRSASQRGSAVPSAQRECRRSSRWSVVRSSWPSWPSWPRWYPCADVVRPGGLVATPGLTAQLEVGS
jgi:hypothetical protein